MPKDTIKVYNVEDQKLVDILYEEEEHKRVHEIYGDDYFDLEGDLCLDDSEDVRLYNLYKKNNFQQAIID